MAVVNPEQAQAGLEEIRARQHQVAAEGMRSPRWMAPAVAGLVLAFNVATELLGGQEFLLLAGYLVLMGGLGLLVRHRRRTRIHRSWYTPQRVLRALAGVALMLVAMAVAAIGAHLLLWLSGLPVPPWLTTGLAQALAVLLLFPLANRVCEW